MEELNSVIYFRAPKDVKDICLSKRRSVTACRDMPVTQWSMEKQSNTVVQYDGHVSGLGVRINGSACVVL